MVKPSDDVKNALEQVLELENKLQDKLIINTNQINLDALLSQLNYLQKQNDNKANEFKALYQAILILIKDNGIKSTTELLSHLHPKKTLTQQTTASP